MTSKKSLLKAIPTNIITGFLGVGKTSAILHLLKAKPSNERWAVLVNEFGEIGIDGSLVGGQHSEEQGVFIREVPGGCMCCTAGVTMQVALNQLLKSAQPDRLLIEPTGLGHPEEILQTLCADNYKDVLLLQKTITLVDARKLADSRYTSHETFNQQIGIADIVVGNKLDLYQDDDKERLSAYVQENTQEHTTLHYAQNGEIELRLLKGKTNHKTVAAHHHHSNPDNLFASEVQIPESGFVKALNKGEGFKSVGWRFSANKVFNYSALYAFLSGLEVERMKAAFITDAGLFGYNLTSDALTEVTLEQCDESRIEIISYELGDALESQLMQCLNT